jgi:hypothetical protein
VHAPPQSDHGHGRRREAGYPRPIEPVDELAGTKLFVEWADPVEVSPCEKYSTGHEGSFDSAGDL